MVPALAMLPVIVVFAIAAVASLEKFSTPLSTPPPIALLAMPPASTVL